MALRAKARSDMRDRSVGRPRPAGVHSLLSRTKPLHRNASKRRGLRAASLDGAGLLGCHHSYFPLPSGERLGVGAGARDRITYFCRSAPCARQQRCDVSHRAESRPPPTEATKPVRSRAQGALLQRTTGFLAPRCDVPLRGTSLHQIPSVAVRGGREGPAGVPDRTSGTFRPGRSPVEKPGRPSRTGWVTPRQRHAGCFSPWLLSLVQARESDPGRASGSDARRRRARSQ
jgi:hypothetical protein